MANGDVLGIVSGHQQFGPIADYATAIDLTDTLATLSQIGGPYDTRGGKSIGLYIELLDFADNSQALDVRCLTRVDGQAWVVCPFIEMIGVNGNPAPTFDVSTYYGSLGSTVGGGRIPVVAYSVATGLLDATVIVAQPLGASPVQAAKTITFDSGATLTFGAMKQAAAADFAALLKVQILDPGTVSHPLRFQSPDGWTFQIVCETDGDGAIVTTAGDVAAAMAWGLGINAYNAPWLIQLTGYDESLGSLLNATAALPLEGGTSDATGTTYRVRGSL